MLSTVLLLRAPAEDSSGPDKYEEAIRARGYRALSVPVLETVHTNLPRLAEVVRARGLFQRPKTAGAGEVEETEDEEGSYAGVIVTSGRACETWRAVVQQLADEEWGEHGMETSSAGEVLRDWSTIPFYTVGQSTADALSAIRTSFPTSPFAPCDIRGAAESGTSEKLAHFIVSNLSTTRPKKRLLYLTGDKNRDTLPSILYAAGLELDSLQVYATQGSSRFEDDLKSALENAEPSGEDELWWIVYFAPSSAKHVFPTLRRYFDMPMKPDLTEAGLSASALRRARVAAIGPTTSTSLESELRIQVDVVATKPSPEALAEGIASWDREHRSPT